MGLGQTRSPEKALAPGLAFVPSRRSEAPLRRLDNGGLCAQLVFSSLLIGHPSWRSKEGALHKASNMGRGLLQVSFVGDFQDCNQRGQPCKGVLLRTNPWVPSIATVDFSVSPEGNQKGAGLWASVVGKAHFGDTFLEVLPPSKNDK